MDVFQAAQTRKSTRAYQDTPVPKEKLERILEAGRLAPSAVNIQPWHFVAVTDQQKRAALASGRFAKFVASAPAVIVVCANQKASPKWHIVDASLALENMVLVATGEDLATCCVGSFEEADVKAAVGVPEGWVVVAMLTVGYSKEKLDLTGKMLKMVRKRKSLSEVVSQDQFGVAWK